MGFPDVCLTPAGPAVVPIPYPNMAIHAMSVPTCPTILLMMLPAKNQASITPITMGDQPGVASPFMGPGIVSMGIPTILLEGMPAVTLASMTTGNNMINPIGAVTVPGAPTVLYSYAAGPAAVGALVFSDGAVEASFLRPGVGRVAIHVFSRAVPAAVHAAITRLEREGLRRLVVDVRDNPGGELLSAVELLRDLLPEGCEVATLVDVEGDEITYRARGDGYAWPLVVRVNGGTASAAELFAGAIKAHGRGLVVGKRTYGKGVARGVTAGAFVDAGRFRLAGGVEVDGVGVLPDVEELPRDW